jgi:hypothetical protein
MCFAMADSREQVARDTEHSRKHVANLLRAGHYELRGSFVTLATGWRCGTQGLRWLRARAPTRSPRKVG